MYSEEKKCAVYVIGHRNPDTDSVVSAAAYMTLKRSLGMAECQAARAGKINPQTEYIFNRFKVPVPEYIPDLIPKVGYYISEDTQTVDENTSLWAAVAKMEESNSKVLPVVDSAGKYHSLLHYNAFAQNILKILNPEKEASILTSISLLRQTLNAQPIVAGDSDELFRCSILVAAAQFETFKQYLHIQPPENTVVITGDRSDIQEYCIENNVRALVISTGSVIEKRLREKAEKRNIPVLISPYDTSSTALLIVYSTPVSTMADTTVKTVRPTDTVRKIRPLIAASPSRCLPVADDSDRIIGILSESDLLREPNIGVILVDHNEITQSVEGVENYTIFEVIDHHRLGNFSTRNPITFINKPVGATSTIITTMFRESRVPIPRDIASILLAGILSDTLALQSTTTTEADREMAEFLSNITNLDIDKLWADILSAASNIGSRSAAELIHQDMKDYTESGFIFSVSQIEVETPYQLVARKEEFLAELEIDRRSRKELFCALMVTDITELTSLLLVSADKPFSHVISFPRQEDSVYILRDIVSRKKQLIPLLSELVGKFADE
ncbi:MAG: putative manganese-dependent inorganic diphosphatase [Spirochaetaceae bacterium]|jgi:manganese-dependent inorganic pyrophosphatase|nr:putative manganese-dependent inorganic diphosphatase [Spirochaetaceae bacterium]